MTKTNTMKYLVFTFVLIVACTPADQAPPEEQSFWTVREYVDEFNEPTGNTYQIAQVTGTRNGKPCQVDIMRSDSLLSFSFGRPIGSDGLFQISIRTTPGESQDVQTYIYQDAITDTREELIRIIQQSEGPVKILADLNRRGGAYSDKYLFELDPAHFTPN